MPNYELKFSIDEKAAAYIEVLRGTATEEDFFRRAMEIGICQLIENTARMNLDYLLQVQTGSTGDYRILRGKLFQIGEPQTPKTQPTTDTKDPMMGLTPRGQPRT